MGPVWGTGVEKTAQIFSQIPAKQQLVCQFAILQPVSKPCLVAAMKLGKLSSRPIWGHGGGVNIRGEQLDKEDFLIQLSNFGNIHQTAVA